jgi:tetratricopeptide (TPR) repeat protein
MRVSPLTEAQGLTYLGDLLSHIQRPADAVVKLEQALALEPNLPMAHASIAMALMQQKNFVKAKEHLAKAVEGNSSNYLAHYYYAYLLSREGMDSDERIGAYSSESARIMQAELRKAIELKADFAESYHLLAFVDLVTGQNLDEAVQLINKAIALSPGSEEYLFVLTQIYLKKQDFAAAKRVIEPLATNASDPGIRATADGLLKSLKSYQEDVARYEREKAAYESQRPEREPAGPAEQTAVTKLSPFAYLEEALRKPETGEIRVQGLLTRLDCTPKGIVYAIKEDKGSLRLSSKDFDGINIMTFTNDVGGELTCGARKGEDFVVVTYKPLKDARAKTDGMLVSIEFVPKDFKLGG